MKVFRIRYKTDHGVLNEYFLSLRECQLFKVLTYDIYTGFEIVSSNESSISKKDSRKFIRSLIRLKEIQGLLFNVSDSDTGSFYFQRKSDSHITRLSDHFDKQFSQNKITWIYNDWMEAINFLNDKV